MKKSILVCWLLCACASAHVTAFRDPDYANRHFAKLAVFAVGMNLDAATKLEQQVCGDVAPEACETGLSIMPPTRVYSTDDVNRYLRQDSVDGVLIVTLAGDQAQTNYIETITSSSATYGGTSSGTATVNGNTINYNGTSSGSASSKTVSTPVYGHSRAAAGYVTLYDQRSGHAAWNGEFRVSGRGVFATTDGAFIGATSKTIASDLREAGLLQQ